MKNINLAYEYSFCTLFDAGYLSRGLTLINSIREQGETAEISILCLDDDTYKFLGSISRAQNLNLIQLEEFLARYPELLQARSSRSLIEFYFTCTPFLLKFNLENKTEDFLSIYLDADLFFFDSPKQIIRDVGSNSVAIIEHNYPRRISRLSAKYGTYNVGLLIFRNDADGAKTLNWWAANCLDWCFDYPENGKYADQGYLDQFENISTNLIVLKNPGYNLAPWNTSSLKISISSGKVLVNSFPLVFFHFHNFKKKYKRWYSSQINYLSPLSKSAFKAIYLPYLEQLEANEEQVKHSVELGVLTDRRRTGIKGYFVNLTKLGVMGLSLLLGQTVKARKAKNRG